jgi:hypothetical protein
MQMGWSYRSSASRSSVRDHTAQYRGDMMMVSANLAGKPQHAVHQHGGTGL